TVRTYILIFVTILLIAGGFFAYTWLQPAATKKPARALGPITRQERPPATQTLRGLGVGESAWVKKYEKGELASQFRGERYEPQPDGTVHVTRPEAEFFSSDGSQRIRIQGVTGNVVVPTTPQGKSAKLQGGE